MSTTEAYSSNAALDEPFEYRSLHSGAIAALVFGVVSLLIIPAGANNIQSSLILCPVPLVGIVVGLRCLGAIRLSPDLYTGTKLALAGVVLSVVGLVAGLGYAGYVYATEVPDGYEATSFNDWRPDEVETRGGELIPKAIQALDGQQVFIKGYMRPGTHVSKSGTVVRHNVSRFLLVRDNNTCCFGDLSSVQYYDKLLVDLKGELTTDYTQGMYRVGGILHIQPANLRRMDGAPVYFLEANYVK